MSGEYDFEPIRGLPAHLPKGERLLWQGAPKLWPFAQRALHVRKVAFYFAILAVARAALGLYDGQPALAAASSGLWMVVLGAVACGVLGLLAWLICRTTVYSITSKRVVIRFGVAIQMSINIPFKVVESAAVKTFADGSGDIPLVLSAEERLSYVVTWPHVRPWQMARPEPMLRGIADAAAVAEILGGALAAAADQPKQPLAETETETDTEAAEPWPAAAGAGQLASAAS